MKEQMSGQGWRVHEVSADLQLRIGRPMPSLSSSLQSEVERLWQDAQRRHTDLFNGRVFSADSIAAHRIIGHWTEFRRIVAQVHDPSLGVRLGLHPLAVSGILVCAAATPGRTAFTEAVIFGRRSTKAFFQAARWQLPPAGAVDPAVARPGGIVDWRGQVLLELHEELGVPAHAIRSMRPVCAVEYPNSRSIDLGVALQCTWSSEQVLEAHRQYGNDEYDELLSVSTDDIMGTACEMADELVGPARIFLWRVFDQTR